MNHNPHLFRSLPRSGTTTLLPTPNNNTDITTTTKHKRIPNICITQTGSF